MVNSIFGEIREKSAGVVHLLNGGVEWELEVSAATLAVLPEVGTESRVFTYLHHREDQMRLYGFATNEERAAFLDLLKVAGIGPRQALKILSRIPLESLVGFIEAGDADALAAVPGLGEKTAGKIIVTLKGKLKRNPTAGDASALAEIVDGLVEMGFDRRAAQEAVKQVGRDLAESGLNGESLDREVLRRAIVALS